jgi:UDPglucose--hexose-1-phosphate uridylyltransferase
MSELRWHPLLEQWVVVTAHRQGRPQMPDNWCPFCALPPYDVYLYPNDFPAFDGGCDVVLYSPDHNQLPSQLSVEQWGKVIDLWTSRTAELQADPKVKHVMVFENAGAAVGVTMPHPHGQIYAFPFVPTRVEKELASVAKSEECLYCLIRSKESQEDVRIVVKSAYFDAFVPYYARFPYESCIYSRRHAKGLNDLTAEEKGDFALILSQMRKKYDALFGFPMPLMMVLHQNVHFYLEFLPLQRSKTKLKYLAAVESASWTFLEDVVPEDAAAQLRSAGL